MLIMMCPSQLTRVYSLVSNLMGVFTVAFWTPPGPAVLSFYLLSYAGSSHPTGFSKACPGLNSCGRVC